jgi:hypothetical protein
MDQGRLLEWLLSLDPWQSRISFLWVDLTFEEPRGALRRNQTQMLNRKSPKVWRLSMTRWYSKSDNLSTTIRTQHLCILTLATAALAYCPLHMLGLRFLAGLWEEILKLERIIKMCTVWLVSHNQRQLYLFHTPVNSAALGCHYRKQTSKST